MSHWKFNSSQTWATNAKCKFRCFVHFGVLFIEEYNYSETTFYRNIKFFPCIGNPPTAYKHLSSKSSPMVRNRWAGSKTFVYTRFANLGNVSLSGRRGTDMNKLQCFGSWTGSAFALDPHSMATWMPKKVFKWRENVTRRHTVYINKKAPAWKKDRVAFSLTVVILSGLYNWDLKDTYCMG
jgi:hypothetical protein